VEPKRDQPQCELEFIRGLRFREGQAAQCAPLPCAGVNHDALGIDSRQVPPIHLFSSHSTAFRFVHLVPGHQRAGAVPRAATATHTPERRNRRADTTGFLRPSLPKAGNALHSLEVPALRVVVTKSVNGSATRQAQRLVRRRRGPRGFAAYGEVMEASWFLLFDGKFTEGARRGEA